MKIAFLNIYNGVVERGSEVFVAELAGRLSSRHEVVVFQTGTKGNTYKAIQISGIPYTPHQTHSARFYHFWVLLFTIKCLPYLWSMNYDWIIPVNGRFQTLVLRLFRFFRGGNILISGHSGVGFDDRVNIQIGNPDVFIALTPGAYQWAKKLTKRPVFYIPNGVNIDAYIHSTPAILSVKKPVILCVSALVEYKRVNLLIEAVSLVKDGNLLLIGDGPLRQSLQEQASKKIPGRFQYIAHVSHDEMPKYYHAADVFSLPSLIHEAFGLVYVEALASNIPVVAPDDENRRTIIGEGGMFCDVKNTEEYAKTLDLAIHKNFSDLPKKQAEKFSWDTIANEYETILTQT